MPRAQRLAFSLILLSVLGMLALAFWRQQPIPGQIFCMQQTLTPRRDRSRSRRGVVAGRWWTRMRGNDRKPVTG